MMKKLKKSLNMTLISEEVPVDQTLVIKLVAAHLLGKYMIDQNTFSEVIPAYYKRIDIHFDDYEKLIEASTNVASKVPKSKI